LGIVIAIPISAIGILFAPQLLGLLGASPQLIRTGARYTSIMLGGNFAILLLFLINAIFRGAGDAAIAMRVLWLANVVNLVLDPCLIFGLGPFPRLGVAGAAVATTCGRSVGVVFQLINLRRSGGRIVIRRSHFRLQASLMWRLMRVSASGILQMLIGTASWIGLMRILASFGSAAVASYTIAIRIIIFALFPSWGLSNAAATLVGQNLGAGKPERGERSVWIAGFYNFLFLGAVGLCFVVFARPLVQVFTDDPAVLYMAVTCLRTISYGFVFYAYGMVLVQAFNGAGDTFTPTMINLFCFWLWEIPLAYVLARPVGLGPPGVFASIAIAFSTIAVVGFITFRRGRWKQARI